MKRIRREQGQSLVELAISLLILLYLVSGAAEFGILFFQYIQLRDAAQEGALYASMHPLTTDIPDIKNRIKYSSTSPINLETAVDSGEVSVGVYIDDDADPTTLGIPSTDATNYPTKACEGHGIKVVVSYKHKVFMPFMSKFIGNEIQLDATVTDTILTPIPDPAAPAGSCIP